MEVAMSLVTTTALLLERHFSAISGTFGLDMTAVQQPPMDLSQKEPALWVASFCSFFVCLYQAPSPVKTFGWYPQMASQQPGRWPF